MQLPDYTEIYNGDRYCLMCRWACPVERVTKSEDLAEVRKCLGSIDRLLQRWASGTDSLAKYIDLNARFCGHDAGELVVIN